MNTEDPQVVRFPVGRGFIVQFKAADGDDEPVFEGRIEQVVSGMVLHFSSAQEMCDAMRTMLSKAPDI